jgi:phosphoribosyl 1,2-cyclic phosphodiesterase
MCVIKGVVVIDEFTLRLPTALYILTHWHSDHYNGITKSWTTPIYCSPITRNLLLTKYPSLESIVTPLPLRQWTSLS